MFVRIRAFVMYNIRFEHGEKCDKESSYESVINDWIEWFILLRKVCTSLCNCSFLLVFPFRIKDYRSMCTRIRMPFSYHWSVSRDEGVVLMVANHIIKHIKSIRINVCFVSFRSVSFRLWVDEESGWASQGFATWKYVS